MDQSDLALLSIHQLLQSKRGRIQRLANRNGAAGEALALRSDSQFLRRPRGAELKLLMRALSESGITIKPTSFDLIGIPDGVAVDFRDADSLRTALPRMTFIEVKTANQTRVKPDFCGFFFALTEGEIHAAEVLGDNHAVLLLNQATGVSILTRVPDILARARSTTWQVSVQL